MSEPSSPFLMMSRPDRSRTLRPVIVSERMSRPCSERSLTSLDVIRTAAVAVEPQATTRAITATTMAGEGRRMFSGTVGTRPASGRVRSDGSGLLVLVGRGLEGAFLLVVRAARRLADDLLAGAVGVVRRGVLDHVGRVEQRQVVAVAAVDDVRLTVARADGVVPALAEHVVDARGVRGCIGDRER